METQTRTKEKPSRKQLILPTEKEGARWCRAQRTAMNDEANRYILRYIRFRSRALSSHLKI
jgi:hypothetical protein